MSVLKSIKVPPISTEDFNNPKYMREIKNYLIQLDETLRYAMENIDDENITKQFIKDLTVGNLLITNGENSIEANPDVGMAFLRGTKKMLAFDILTGDTYFGGEMVGGSIESSNYSKDEFNAVLSGMRIDLEDGSIEAPGFKYNDGVFRLRSELEEGSNKYVLTINDGETDFTVFHYYMNEMENWSSVGHDGFYSKNLLPYYSASYTAHGIEIMDGPASYLFVVNGDNMVYKGYRVINGEILNDFEVNLKQWATDSFATDQELSSLGTTIQNWAIATFAPKV